MHKNLLILILSLTLLSCQSNVAMEGEKTAKNDNELIEKETPQPYQTIVSEEQAQALNKEAEAENQEIEVEDRIFFSSNSSSVKPRPLFL